MKKIYFQFISALEKISAPTGENFKNHSGAQTVDIFNGFDVCCILFGAGWWELINDGYDCNKFRCLCNDRKAYQIFQL